MVSAISNSLAGLQAASQKVEKASERIANATTPGQDVDLITEAVNLKLGEIEYKANVKTLQASNELLDETLRIFDKKV